MSEQQPVFPHTSLTHLFL